MRTGLRRLPWDWFDAAIPDNVSIGEGAYIETAHSFTRFESEVPDGASFGDHSSLYKTSMLDVGPGGSVSLGRYALVQGARIICDARVEIGAYAMISWKVLIMDSYRWPRDIGERAEILVRIARTGDRRPPRRASATPVIIGRNAWIGSESCIMPGVTIGEGAIVGARTVVTGDVEPFTVVAGNPARVLRKIEVHGDLRDRELSEFLP